MQLDSDLVYVPPAAPGAQWRVSLARWLEDAAEPGPSETEQPSQSTEEP